MLSENLPDRIRPPAARTPGWWGDGAAAATLALVSLLIGCLLNLWRKDPLPWLYASRAKAMDVAVAELSPRQASVDVAEAAPPREVGLEEFQSFATQRAGLVIDARARAFYDLGHVPGAVSLPREAFARDYPRLREQLEAHKDRPVAVYCSGPDCLDAQLLADALSKLGYRRLMIYTSGWEEWSQTGLPQEGSAAPP